MPRRTHEFTRNDHGYIHRATAYTDDDGRTWRWVTNDAPCPLDACREYNIPCDVVDQFTAIEEYTAKVVEEYRRNWQPPSEETRAEIMSEIGPDAIDVVAGRRIFPNPNQVQLVCQNGIL